MLLALSLTMLFPGCSEKQDFDQYEQLSLEPILEGSLLYIEAPERIINQANGVMVYTFDLRFEAFSSSIFSERAIEGSITYFVENTTSKPLDVTAEFLDASGNVLDTENFTIAAAPTAIIQRDIEYGPNGRSIDIIKNTVTIRITAQNLGDTTSVSSFPDPKVKLTSRAQFRVRVK